MILAMIVATGSHWALLQSVAWTRMVADNLRTGSLAEALEKTFDGRHPCCLCKAIAAGKKSEKKHAVTMPSQKLEFAFPQEDFVLITPSSCETVPSLSLIVVSFPHKPPTPPPRDLLG